MYQVVISNSKTKESRKFDDTLSNNKKEDHNRDFPSPAILYIYEGKKKRKIKEG